MQTIYVLNQEVDFELVARFLFETDLELGDVLSCTFPSRPEPKSACWKTKSGQKVIGYSYLPDIELRYLQLLDRGWSGFDASTDAAITDLFAEKTPVVLFTDWSELERDLNGDEYRKIVRSASAFQTAAQAKDSSVDGEKLLVDALKSDATVTRNVVATAIADVATSKHEAEIRACFDHEQEPEIRFQLRRAIDKLMSRL